VIIDLGICTVLAAALAFSSLGATHPGEYHDNLEIARQMNERSLDAEEQFLSYQRCQNTVERREMQERAHSRRSERPRKLREERGVTEDGESFVPVMSYYRSFHNAKISLRPHPPPS
jgi:hypothetical protein